MVTVISQPTIITPGKNPVRWVLETDNYVQSAAVVAVWKFTLSGSVGIGETITFNYADNEFTMTAFASATITGYSLPIGDGGTAHKGDILLYLQANYYLNRDFVISLSGNDFIFTARTAGAESNQTDSTDTFANGAWSMTTMGADAVLRPNFKIGIDVYVENVYGSNNYTLLQTKYFIPNAANQVDVDLQEELQAFLERETNAPTFNQTAYSTCTNINKRWYITYFEYYGETPVSYRQTTSGSLRVIKGGIARDKWLAVASDFRLLWLGNALSGTVIPKFLITRRQMRTVTLKQQEFLYYIPSGAISNARLRAKVTYSDNTTTTTTIATYSSLGGQLTFLFPAGYTQLNLAALEAGRTPVSYIVYLDNTSGAAKSEVIQYNIVESSHIERYFIYENSIGAWETLRTEGIRTHLVETEKSEFQGILPNNYTAEQGEMVSSTEFFQQSFEVYTGHYFTKDEALDLIDLLKAENIFEVVIDDTSFIIGSGIVGRHVSATIDKGSFSLNTDDNYQYGIKFTYRRAYKEQNYSWR